MADEDDYVFEESADETMLSPTTQLAPTPFYTRKTSEWSEGFPIETLYV